MMITTYLAVATFSILAGATRMPIKEGDDVFATIENGVLRGVVARSLNVTLYKRFIGIPFAAPPVGELRFCAPLPAANWSGVRDALTFGPYCAQLGIGSEDCLMLNVYVPLSAAAAGELLPVMTHIHGGGFVQGNTWDRTPDYFMDKGVALVTTTYRLGSLGFLSLVNDDIPGNAGLKDQVFALQWVQRNIAAFGGDPDRVTAFGESAGSASTSHLLLSPAAKGLFRAAIFESGVATNVWAMVEKPREKAYRLATALGFQPDGVDDADVDARLAAFLRAANHSDLTIDDMRALSDFEKRTPIPMAFLPIVERPSASAVITEHPAEILKKGSYNHVPVMMGVTSGEGDIVFMNATQAADMTENFAEIMGALLPLPTLEERTEAAKKIEQFYFGDGGFNISDRDGYCQMVTDLYFIHSAELFAEALVNTSSVPVYFYYLSYNGTGNILCGMIHCGETLYIFAKENGGPDKDPNSNDGKVRERLITLWTNFAKYSEPAPDNSPVTWNKFTASSRSYLDMGVEFVMQQKLLKERMDLWREILIG